MKAMILAAGLATRLKPLTDHIPKALVRFNTVPLLHRVVNNIFDAGIEAIVVNVHHFPDQVINFLQEQKYYGGRVVISDEKEQLMDTGGAIIHAAWFLNDGNPFLVHNVDVYTNLNIKKLIDYHLKGNGLATIAVKDRPTSRSLLFDDQLQLIGWKHNETGEEIHLKDKQQVAYAYGNSCVQVIQPEFFKLVNLEGPFSLTESYLDLARDHTIRGFEHNDDYWFDLGRYENFNNAESFFTPH
ncbi:MAG: NTP transferase domain-containing protein [Bacteroidales bacterium]|nr:NTP transferase domain-containing protein [Bacteroidales bacterium]